MQRSGKSIQQISPVVWKKINKLSVSTQCFIWKLLNHVGEKWNCGICPLCQKESNVDHIIIRCQELARWTMLTPPKIKLDLSSVFTLLIDKNVVKSNDLLFETLILFAHCRWKNYWKAVHDGKNSILSYYNQFKQFHDVIQFEIITQNNKTIIEKWKALMKKI